MATDIIGSLTNACRLEDAEAVSERLLAHAPDSVLLKLMRADVLAHLLQRDIIGRYKLASEMTPEVRAYADDLYRQNMAAFAQAEALGWRDPSGKL